MPPCRPPTGSKFRNVRVLLTFLMCVNLQHFVTERVHAHAHHNKPLAVIYGISTEISRTSIFQRRFQEIFHARFQDFNGDFRISRRLSERFQAKRYQQSRVFSGHGVEAVF